MRFTIFNQQSLMRPLYQRLEQGKVGYALLWLLGIPLPVLLAVYFLRGK